MDRRIALVISKMEREMSATPTLEGLGRQVNLSASRLRHLFKLQTGKTPAQYLKDLRLRQAELLLRTTFLSVKEITSRVGLTTGSHFVREFRKIHGMAPTTYRNLVGPSAKADSGDAS